MISAKPSIRATEELNDVFVIGAGASVPYGFPTGVRLLSQLRQEQLSYNDRPLLEILDSLDAQQRTAQFDRCTSEYFETRCWDHSPDPSFCLRWTKMIRGSVILSIDQFLKNVEDKNLREFGKRWMARKILNAEANACDEPKQADNQSTSSSMHSIDWIQQFLTRVDLLGNWDEYLRRAAFLTFNYDRVLEFFLERYLVVDKNLSRDEARSFVEDMQIHHMNGYLGPLSEISFGNLTDPNSELDPLFDPPSRHAPSVKWSAVANRMRTVWEDPDHHPDAKETQAKAKEATSKAKRIFVIGTSFIPENLEAIGLLPVEGTTKPWGQANLLATAKGLSKAQMIRAADQLKVRGKNFLDMNALDFVVDHVVL